MGYIYFIKETNSKDELPSLNESNMTSTISV